MAAAEVRPGAPYRAADFAGLEEGTGTSFSLDGEAMTEDGGPNTTAETVDEEVPPLPVPSFADLRERLASLSGGLPARGTGTDETGETQPLSVEEQAELAELERCGIDEVVVEEVERA